MFTMFAAKYIIGAKALTRNLSCTQFSIYQASEWGPPFQSDDYNRLLFKKSIM